MKTTEEIDKQILGIDWFIKSHKNQIDFKQISDGVVKNNKGTVTNFFY